MRTYRAKRVEPRYVLTAQAGLSFGFAEIHLLSVGFAQSLYALLCKHKAHTTICQGLIAQKTAPKGDFDGEILFS